MTRTFDGSPSFTEGARRNLGNEQLRANLARATTTIRAKRDRVVAELDTWEDLRRAGEAVKSSALSRLDELLVQLETNVTRAGGVVHWARDSAEANRIVVGLVQAAGRDGSAGHDGPAGLVKVKSMTTAETGLNQALEAAGIRAYETDLAELIVQLGDDLPSHIVVPAIHRNREEIRTTFLDHMGEWGRPAPPDLTSTPTDLAAAARVHLRERFLAARIAVSGANFLVADTGAAVVVESEGNGRMCLTLPDTLVTVAGIDKVVPSWEDLDTLLQLLPRSATGERMNPYTSVWTGVTPGDGPSSFHLVLLDNGRSAALADTVGRQALRCIRCAACLNVCPVYERVGGHAYGSVYPGPIGAVLTPQLDHVAGDEVAASLPYASTLCGACFDACPVRIDIPRLLVHLRAEVVDTARGSRPTREEQAVMAAAAWALGRPRRLDRLVRAGRILTRLAGSRSVGSRRMRLPGLAGRWSATRVVPLPHEHSFAEWWRSTHGEGDADRSRTAVKAEQSRRTGRVLSPVPTAAGLVPSRSAQSPTGPGAARDVVLQRIRAALVDPRVAVEIPRDYRRPPGPRPDPVALFMERVADYRATIRRTDLAGLAAAITEALRGHGTHDVVVPGDLDPSWLLGTDAMVRRDAPPLSVAELDRMDSVVTASAVAIAETGTVVLDGGVAQGRRALTLVPDHHVVVVREDQIVANVPEAIGRLEPARPQTWISGPSATSDIELNRVEGVHGPRHLDVIVVGEGSALQV